MKKSVSSSNLALRFYKRDGWTILDLKPYLLNGDIEDTQIVCEDVPEYAYFRLTPHSKLDMDRFYEEKVFEVFRAFDDYPEMTDLEFLKSKNW